MNYIGQKVKVLRKRKNLTQVELGKRIGVLSTTVTGYENGNVMLADASLAELADALDIPFSELIAENKHQKQYENKRRMNKLKPCPFCSNEHITFVTTYIENIFTKGIKLECDDCGASTTQVKVSADYSAKEIAVKLWNRRKDDEND